MGSGSSTPVDAKARVVVVGGGYGGCAFIKDIAGKVGSITLVEPREAFFHCIGAPRALVEANFEKKLSIPYDRFLTSTGTVHDRAALVGVDPAAKTITVRGVVDGVERAVAFDILVLAMGSSSSIPSSLTARETSAGLASIRAAALAADSIVVVGGGAVGVEISGELGHDLKGKGKTIALVNSGETLLSNVAGTGPLPAAFKSEVASHVSALGVQLKLGVQATLPVVSALPAGVTTIDNGRVFMGPHDVALSDGSVIRSGLTYVAGGGAPNTAALRTGPLASVLDGSGFIRVQPSLLVEGQTRIFALGDVAASGDPKLGYAAGRIHAPIVARNALAVLKAAVGDAKAAAGGKPAAAPTVPQLKARPAPSTGGTMILTFGRGGGIGLLGGTRLPNFMIKAAKAGDLITVKYNGELGWKKDEVGVYPGTAPRAAHGGAAAGAAADDGAVVASA